MTGLAMAQLGARRHYAVPRIMEEAGLLNLFFTDFWLPKRWDSRLRLLPPRLSPAGLKRVAGRRSNGVPDAKIVSFPALGCEYALRRRLIDPSAAPGAYLDAGAAFCRKIIAHGLGSARGVYTFSGAGLELMHYARDSGRVRIMDQTIASQRLQRQLLREERDAFPMWADREKETTEERDNWERAAEREQAEWACANLILCGSEFVRESLIQLGVQPERCVSVPYGVDASFSQADRPSRNGPLRALTVGGVGLRKGSPYVLEAARRLKGRVEFRLVGPIGVPERAASELRQAVQLVGPRPRSEIREHLQWADVFVLPSICEGSAGAIYEALSSGLPVVTTPNAGSIVRDGVDGFVVPIRDVDTLVARLVDLADSRELRSYMGANAAQAYLAEGNIGSWSKRLLKCVRSAMGQSDSEPQHEACAER